MPARGPTRRVLAAIALCGLRVDDFRSALPGHPLLRIRAFGPSSVRVVVDGKVVACGPPPPVVAELSDTADCRGSSFGSASVDETCLIATDAEELEIGASPAEDFDVAVGVQEASCTRPYIVCRE